jgi:hypothetical protein
MRFLPITNLLVTNPLIPTRARGRQNCSIHRASSLVQTRFCKGTMRATAKKVNKALPRKGTSLYASEERFWWQGPGGVRYITVWVGRMARARDYREAFPPDAARVLPVAHIPPTFWADSNRCPSSLRRFPRIYRPSPINTALTASNAVWLAACSFSVIASDDAGLRTANEMTTVSLPRM